MMVNNIRILMLEDIAEDVEMVERKLREEGFSFILKCAETEDQFLGALKEFEPDIILVDYTLPSYDGMTALSTVREQCSDIPFVFVSGTMGEETAIEALKGGATDYVLKNKMSRLGPAIRRALAEKGEHLKRLQAENLLADSEKRYRSLFETANDGILLLEKSELKIRASNPAILEMLGYSNEELIGKGFTDIGLADNIVNYQEVMQTLNKNGIICYKDALIQKKTGQVVDTDIYMVDGAGLVQCNIRNITERKLAEKELKNSMEKYVLAVKGSNDGIWDWDLLTNETFFSEKWKEQLGYADHELENNFDTFENLLHPDDKQSVLDFVKRYLEGEIKVYSFELRMRHKDGSYRWILARGEAIRDEDGKPFRMAGSHSDITERKLAETYREMGREILQILNEPGDLQESIQRFLAVLKTRTGFDAVGFRLQEGEDFPYFAQDGFSKDFLLTENTLLERGKDGGVCRDKDGNVCLECTCGLVISGKTDPSNPLFTQGGSCWTNDSFRLLDLPSDQDPRTHPRNNCIHQGYASVALIPVRTSDRIVGLVQLNDKRKDRFTPETIAILEGIAAHIGSALMRKRTEEEREKLQAQFLQAQKMESVGRLAGGVAHDYNNMLSVILGYTELALEKVDPSESLHANLIEIFNAARRSTDITRQLLAFARKQTIAPKVLDINEIVESMLKMLRRLIGEDIDLYWLPESNLRPIKIDASQVEQVLANLCVNARDAIAGVGKVTIETHMVTFDDAFCAEHAGFVPGDFVLLAVSDDGCGMDTETLESIFEPFFTTKDVNQGTGLGLATVYGIVKQNEGFINVYSEPGEGTTFKIYMPCHLGKAEKIWDETVTGIPKSHGEMVLLVEDEPAIRKMGQMMLERLGYRVLTAATPGEALRLAGELKGAIHLLITDVVMPGMNGRDLTDQLQTPCPDIKILFMSGYTANVIAHRGVLKEGVNFIQKPFSMKDLGVKIRAILDQK